MKESNQETFEQDVAEHDRVVVDFWAPWCGPCRMLGASLQRLVEETETPVIKVNIDENMELAQKYGVSALPTMVVLEGGEEVKRHVGMMMYSGLKDWAAK